MLLSLHSGVPNFGCQYSMQMVNYIFMVNKIDVMKIASIVECFDVRGSRCETKDFITENETARLITLL